MIYAKEHQNSDWRLTTDQIPHQKANAQYIQYLGAIDNLPYNIMNILLWISEHLQLF